MNHRRVLVQFDGTPSDRNRENQSLTATYERERTAARGSQRKPFRRDNTLARIVPNPH